MDISKKGVDKMEKIIVISTILKIIDTIISIYQKTKPKN